jgi:uncharacterized iron-regulated membrane protein
VRALRKALFWVHLAAGSLAGVVILVMCATGVLLAFQPQALRLVERNARRIPPAERTSLQRLGAGTLLRLATEAVAASPGDSPATVTVSADPAETATVAFGRERSSAAARGHGARSSRRRRTCTAGSRSAARAAPPARP